MSSSGEWLKTLEADVQALHRALGELDSQVTRLREAGEADSTRAHEALEAAFGHAGKARGAIEGLASAHNLPVPAGLEAAGRELSARVAQLQEGPRRILRALADELHGGAVKHQRPAKQRSLDAARQQAIVALREAAEAELPPAIPAPAGPSWLGWWWSLPGERQDELLSQLNIIPALPLLLDNLDSANWPTLAPASPAPAPGVTPQPVELNGHVAAPLPTPAAAPSPAPAPVPKPVPKPRATPAPVVEPEPEPALAVRPVASEEVFRFATFRKRYWIAPGGECRPAPWADLTAFASLLVHGMNDALVNGDMLRLYLCARALPEFGLPAILRPADVRSLAAVWAHPHDSSAGLDDARVDWLRDADGLANEPRWKLALFLESIRPSRDRYLLPDDAEALLDAVHFHDRSLEKVIRGLLHAAPMLPDALPAMREQYRQRAESPEVLRERLVRARVHLQDLVKNLWNAAGGKIQRTHCRQAWDDFMAELRPALEPLYSEGKGVASDWDVAERRAELDRLAGRGTAVIEDRGVRYQDRTAFHRTTAEMLGAARDVNEALDRLHAASGRKPKISVPLPTDSARLLRAGKPVNDPLEELCRQVLLRVLEDHEPSPEPLDITPRLLADYPELLPLLDQGDPGVAGDDSEVVFHVEDILPGKAGHAAALLLTPVPSRPDADGSVAQLLERVKHHPDVDVTSRAIGLQGQLRDQGHAHARRAERAEHLRALADSVEEQAGVLDMLAADVTGLREALAEAETLTSSILAGSEGMALAEAWLTRLDAYASGLRAHELDVLRHRAMTEPADRRSDLLKAIQQGDYGAIQPLLSGQQTNSREDYRKTAWRWRAEGRYGKPEQAARKIARLFSEELAQAWRPITGSITRDDRPLRTALARFLFPDTVVRDEKTRKDYHDFTVSAHRIADHFTALGENPTWLPQLRRFSSVVLLTPGVKLTSQTIGDELRRQVAEYPSSLCVFLVPQATAQFRREHLAWMRDKRAVLFDDYDLCRLLEPDGGSRPPALLGFLEIVFEQLNWAHHCPFSLDDGQRVALEMFVGRSEEAKALAQTSTYSRLFSGRKLGKSALLRYIEETYDKKPLPSGPVLRVVYVPAAGIASEPRLATAILKALRDKVGFDPAGLTEESQAERLLEALDRYPDERPNESLLIILDEADRFVEEQVREYYDSETRPGRREEVLSFRIRSQTTGKFDSGRVPRVRVLYSGYRSTNVSQGTWSGAGSDYLRLEPLSPEQGADLIAGPLARLGIDAARQAQAIAHRCGCQPIVLLRFGQRLLERLDQAHPASMRDRSPVAVTSADVAEAFKDSRVQDEIWDVAKANFEGNDRGFVVFAALLLEFSQRSPGAALADPETWILKRLDEIDPTRSWLASGDDDPYAVLAKEFSDLSDRHLLVSHGPKGYSLRFPHHLPVLMRNNLVASLKERLRLVRPGSAKQGGQAFLPPAHLNNLHRALFSPDPEMPIRVVAVASLWPDAVEDPESPGNLAERLDPEEATRLARAGDEPAGALAARDVLMMAGTTPELAEAVLAKRASGMRPPLFLGGAALLRWALAREREGELLDVRAVGRLPGAVLRWWFVAVRGFEFDAPDAIERIEKLTSGVPLLVEVFDRLLRAILGDTNQRVSEGQFQLVLEEYDGERDPAARKLAEDDPAYALSPRELDILHMVATVSRENGYNVPDMAQALVTEWELYQDLCPARPRAYNPSSDDPLALDLVQKLGLLPSRAGARPLDRLVAVPQGDALWKIEMAARAAREAR